MRLLQEFVFLTFMVHQLFAEFVAPGTEFPPPRHRRTARLCKFAQFRGLVQQLLVLDAKLVGSDSSNAARGLSPLRKTHPTLHSRSGLVKAL